MRLSEMSTASRVSALFELTSSNVESIGGALTSYRIGWSEELVP